MRNERLASNVKNLKVTQATELQMVNEYSRDKNKKSVLKTTFNIVVSGLLISSTMIGTLTFATPPTVAYADTVPETPIVRTIAKAQFMSEKSMVASVNGQIKVIEAAIKQNGLSIKQMKTLTAYVSALSSRITANRLESTDGTIASTIMSVEKTLSKVNDSVVIKADRKLVTSEKSVIQKVDKAVLAQIRTLKTSQPTTPAVTPAPVVDKSHISERGITCLYGKHDYGCKNQAEYDYVMSIVTPAVKNYLANPNQRMNGEHDPLYSFYHGGSRNQEDYASSRDYIIIGGVVSQDFAVKKTPGMTDDLAWKIIAGGNLAFQLEMKYNAKADTGSGIPNSAYYVLHDGWTDCDASAQLQIAVWDSLGLNTMIWGRPSEHAWPLVQSSTGAWMISDIGYRTANLDVSRANGDKMVVAPTHD